MKFEKSLVSIPVKISTMRSAPTANQLNISCTVAPAKALRN